MYWTDREIMELDLRVVAPIERHALIFRTFDALEVGESFVIIVDHDPKALWEQFHRTRRPFFGWEYLERGPRIWRIGIWKHTGGAGVTFLRVDARERSVPDSSGAADRP